MTSLDNAIKRACEDAIRGGLTSDAIWQACSYWGEYYRLDPVFLEQQVQGYLGDMFD